MEIPAPRTASLPSRLLLWVDGAGTFLLLRSERIALGRGGSSMNPHVPLAGDLESIHAEILRVDDDYFLTARGPVEVNGRAVQEKLLADGDELRLGNRASARFRLPSRLAATAILHLGSGQRIDGHIGKVILLDRALLLGPGENDHVRLRGDCPRVVLAATPEGLELKAPETIEIDGRTAGMRAPVPVGARVRVGKLSFTITEVKGGQ